VRGIGVAVMVRISLRPRIFFTNKTMPKRIQLPDDFYKHDFKQLAKIEKHPRIKFIF
jgi:hypothetical protein